MQQHNHTANGAGVDLNEFIPTFMAATPDRQRKALAVLNGEDLPYPKNDPADEKPTRWLNQKELAKRLAIDPVTVRRWKIPCKRLGKVPRYDWQEVEAYLAGDTFKRHYRRVQQTRSAR